MRLIWPADKDLLDDWSACIKPAFGRKAVKDQYSIHQQHTHIDSQAHMHRHTCIYTHIAVPLTHLTLSLKPELTLGACLESPDEGKQN